MLLHTTSISDIRPLNSALIVKFGFQTIRISIETQRTNKINQMTWPIRLSNINYSKLNSLFFHRPALFAVGREQYRYFSCTHFCVLNCFLRFASGFELLVWFYFDKGSSQNFPFRILSKITRNAFLVASLTPPKYTGKRKYVRDWIKVPKAQQREWLKRTSATKHLNNCRSRNLFVSLLKTVIYFWLQFRIHPIAKSRVWKSKIRLSSSDRRFFLFSSWRWLSGQ